MDHLTKAYSTASDDEEVGSGSKYPDPLLPHLKRTRCETPKVTQLHVPVFRRKNLPTEAPIPGGYISKRQRAALATDLKQPNSDPSFDPSPGSLSDTDLPHSILTTLRQRTKGSVVYGQASQSLSASLSGHVKSVNVVQWSTTHAHLLASAGMDHSVCIWNVWSISQKRARVLNCHQAAVKDVKWSPHGTFVLSCGYDCASRLVDVEKGIETQIFKEDQFVDVIKFCPGKYNLFISGGSKGLLKLWDIRTGKAVYEYVRSLGPILDAEFTVDGKHLITSSDESKSNLSENSIIVWDVSRQVPLSNQQCFVEFSILPRHVMWCQTLSTTWVFCSFKTILFGIFFQVYAEAYTCPSIRCHPLEPYFIAQSNGNYIAIFSSKHPFKLDKYKRYEGHGVSGFPIKCNFNLDGKIIASGSSDGCIYFYNSKTSKLIKKIKAYEQACVDVVFHPSLPDVIASCSWNGQVSVFDQDLTNAR
ncbi:hypothetical protein ACJIZ3_012680 [Penstemon smallii]|uniref:WD repeat-containing protein 25 n=1 Tax=Penstemon smallii TaxID=265156 RepID=A0ABD3UQZ8_9LAMI